MLGIPLLQLNAVEKPFRRIGSDGDDDCRVTGDRDGDGDGNILLFLMSHSQHPKLIGFAIRFVTQCDEETKESATQTTTDHTSDIGHLTHDHVVEIGDGTE